MTWFTAFASLSMMIGLALRLGGSAGSGLWIVLLAATGSLRPLLNPVFGNSAVEAYAGYQSGFAGWLFQSSWAPQHMASAMCAVLAVVLLNELARRPRLLVAVLSALVMAAAFESSVWIGGIVVPLAAAILTLFSLERLSRQSQPAHPVVGRYGIDGPAADCATAVRPAAAGRHPRQRTAVCGLALRGTDRPARRPDLLRRHMLAYWVIFLVVAFPAFYLTGIGAVVVLLLSQSRAPERHSAAVALALLLAVSLGVSWLLVSTLGDNNDVGWRAVLPGAQLLIVFSALALSRWLERPVSLPRSPRWHSSCSPCRMASNSFTQTQCRRRTLRQTFSRQRRRYGRRCGATRRRQSVSPTIRHFSNI